jgi:hypothetical protein
MQNVLRMVPVFVMTGAVAYALGVDQTSSASAAVTHEVNACGCYRDASGSCYCGKRSTCDCPGDCEPRGCEEKRAKEMDKEIQAETRRAQDAERRQQQEAEAKRRQEQQAAEAEPPAASGNSQESASGDLPEDPVEAEAAASPKDDTAAVKGESGGAKSAQPRPSGGARKAHYKERAKKK